MLLLTVLVLGGIAWFAVTTYNRLRLVPGRSQGRPIPRAGRYANGPR